VAIAIDDHGVVRDALTLTGQQHEAARQAVDLAKPRVHVSARPQEAT
jgi:hypothetical protein